MVVDAALMYIATAYQCLLYGYCSAADVQPVVDEVLWDIPQGP